MKQRALLLLLLLPLGSALLFTITTHQVWEDYLITVRHSENLVNGNGLVYQPGERVHGFTSVINTLVPAVALAVSKSFDFSLNLYRACSLGALLAGLYYLWRTLAVRLAAGSLEIVAGALLVATSVKIIAFTMNGQETGFLVGFFAIGIAAAIPSVGAPPLDRLGALSPSNGLAGARAGGASAAPTDWIIPGLAWAGLLYTRPDSPLYIAILIGLGSWTTPITRADYLKSVVRSASLAALLYAPWFIFAWVYYGSPVPHTVVAKAADSFFANGSTLATFIGMWSSFPEIAGDTFGPVYGVGGWPGFIGWAAILGGAGASLIWLSPRADRFARGCSFALLVTLAYLSLLKVQREAYPWYFGPASLLGILVWCRLLSTIPKLPVRVGVGALALACVFCFGLSLRQLRIHQVEVEDNTRKAIGVWLKGTMAPGDSVYLEPIGYIGYYSGAKILDFPGLVAPEVVAARRNKRAGFAELPTILKPKWIVARRSEIDRLQAVPGLVEAYQLVREFNNLEEFDKKYGIFAGSAWLRYDLWYVVLRRRNDI